MKVKADPGGFPQLRLSEVPSVTPAQMREIQRVAQESFGYDILQIIENAGRAAARLALAMLGGRARGQRIVVLAGGGNAGASGLCAIRNLVNWGLDAEPILGEVGEQMSFATARQLRILQGTGTEEPEGPGTSEITAEEHLHKADLILDALVGYGLTGPPTGMAAAIVEMAMASRTPVLALDVPTGVDADSGQVNHPAISACTTLIYDLPKIGQLKAGARARQGELYLADLGIPRAIPERMGIAVKGLHGEGPIVRLRK
jgi:NAD(P)H-hydrate epimerase